MISRRLNVPIGLVLLALAGCAIGDGEQSEGKQTATQHSELTKAKSCSTQTLAAELCDPAKAKFILASKNRHFPLMQGSLVVLEGVDDGEKLRVERRVLPATKVVAGVTTHVLEAKEFRDGELHEVTRGFYAETEDGNVCSLGEDVSRYDDGLVESTKGSWRAGVQGAKPGLIMPANPTVGQTYAQERLPGSALQLARVDAIGGTLTAAGIAYRDVVTVAAVTANSCSTRDRKLYVPGIGEAGDTDTKLVSFTEGPFEACHPPTIALSVCDPATGKFSLASTNKYYPLVPGNVTVLEGDDAGTKIIVVRKVLLETAVIAGVTTHVLEARELKADKLYEVARNYYVEATDGTVCYFGEDVTFYADDGTVANHNGTWRAGFGRAKPGVIMPNKPTVGQVYFQEDAPGVAHDMGRVAGATGTLSFGGKTYSNIVTIKDSNPLNTCAVEEDKFYVPGIGEAGDTVKRLVSFTPGK